MNNKTQSQTHRRPRGNHRPARPRGVRVGYRVRPIFPARHRLRIDGNPVVRHLPLHPVSHRTPKQRQHGQMEMKPISEAYNMDCMAKTNKIDCMKDKHKPTPQGYIRINQGKLKFEHVIVWEKFFGKIPDGYQIHHIDGNKANNDIENLQLVTALEHRRIHEGCKFVIGEWYKPCSVCGEYKPCTPEYWYFSRGTINGKLCKACYVKKSLRVRKKLIENGWKRKSYPRKKTT